LGSVLIDWLSAILPVGTIIPGGTVLTIDSDGELVNERRLRSTVSGSWSSTVEVCNVWADKFYRGKPLPVGELVVGTSVYISGNPAKYLQGHNVYGSDDINQLAALFFEQVAISLNLDKNTQDLWYQLGLSGNYEPTRIDITYNYRVEGGSEGVNAWIRAAHTNARVSHKSASPLENNTLYFGKHSRRHTIKFYNKYAEMKDHPPCPQLRDLRINLKDALISAVSIVTVDSTSLSPLNYDYIDEDKGWSGSFRNSFNTIVDKIKNDADGILRVEQCFRGKKLRDMGHSKARGLDAMVIRQLYDDGLKGLTLSGQTVNNAVTAASVGRGTYNFYVLWLAGALDLTIYGRSHVSAQRKKLLAFGVDISLPVSPSNGPVVVPLIRVLEAVPVSAPAFYYEYQLLAAA